jgi:1-acyl-sn-glycerol-3-phosphate acyltransferase
MATARRRKPPQRWSRVQSRTFYRFALVVVTLILRFWVRRWRFVGVEHVPRSGGAFLVANHTSGVDPLILGAAFPFRMMAGPGKVELFKNRFFSLLMRRLGIFPLRPGEADAAAVRTMVDLYRHGRVVIVYPEGGRSATDTMKPFTPDFARLVIKLKAPIIPAGIAGARDLLPIHSWVPRPGRPITVVAGEPFELSQFYGRPSTPELLQEATDILQSRVAELVDCARREREALLRSG